MCEPTKQTLTGKYFKIEVQASTFTNNTNRYKTNNYFNKNKMVYSHSIEKVNKQKLNDKNKKK